MSNWNKPEVVFIITCLVFFPFTNGDSVNIQREKKLVLHSDVDIAQEVMQLKDQFINSTRIIAALESKMTALETEKAADKTSFTAKLQAIEKDNTDMKGQIASMASSQQSALNLLSTGSTYVRWGRNVCPLTSYLVYRGYMAGKHYNLGGSGTDNVCLPFEPTWAKYKDGNEAWGRAHIYGTEIDTDDSNHIFDYAVNNQNLPCAVCRTDRSISLMIPARVNCYHNWTLEYTGYLMAGTFNVPGAYNHVCVDHSPQFVPHGGNNDDEHTIYFVEGQCGSLPCPPYVQGREMACVVCSK